MKKKEVFTRETKEVFTGTGVVDTLWFLVTGSGTKTVTTLKDSKGKEYIPKKK